MAECGVDKDPASGSNFAEIVSTHLDMDWTLDFESEIIVGSVTHTLKALKDGVSKLDLDSRAMAVLRAEVLPEARPLTFWLSDEAPIRPFGTRLHVLLPNPLPKGQEIQVRIFYRTLHPAPHNVSALQWLPASATADKTAPFLFSQSQAIHARSLLPCMDTPAVKATYSAVVHVPGDAMVALMSAVGDPANAVPPRSADGRHRTFAFRQAVPIPSYLIALVAGALVKRDISRRSAVWAEPSVVEAAAWEFAETEEILAIAESILTPYSWGRYDLLVLPPTFPFGGMENPCLTFVTPTLLAGDRSLTYVVAHEIAHSWTGNLVTNATWEHFWLNEGFTCFLERKITGRLLAAQFPGTAAEAQRDALAIEGLDELRYAVHTAFHPKHPYTRLCIRDDRTDPDDAFSAVPYEKGHAFLHYLEKLVGGPGPFDAWLKLYVRDFQGRSLATQQWKDHFTGHFAQTDFSKVDWDGWFHSPGMPLVEPTYDDSLLRVAKDLAKAWIAGQQPATNFTSLSSCQKVHLVDQLLGVEKGLPAATLQAMEGAYKLSGLKNAEILARWIRLGLQSHWEPIIQTALDFVRAQGRLKFTLPVYRALAGWVRTKPLALERFAQCRKGMHPMTVSLVVKELGLHEKTIE